MFVFGRLISDFRDGLEAVRERWYDPAFRCPKVVFGSDEIWESGNGRRDGLSP